MGNIRRNRDITMQMSPALSVLFLLIGIAAVVYVYRKVVIDTLLTMLLAAGLLAAFLAIIAFTISSILWFRRRRRLLRTATEPMPALDAAEMEQDADFLASGGVELAFTPDGKSLVARKPETEPEPEA